MPSLLKVFYNQVALFLPKALSGVCIFAGFWIGALILKAVILRAGRRTRVEPGLIHLLARTAQILSPWARLSYSVRGLSDPSDKSRPSDEAFRHKRTGMKVVVN